MSWRVARSLLTLRSQYNAAFPSRSTAYDGTIGDAAHQRAGTSDHLPGADGIVQAIDLTATPAQGKILAAAAIATLKARGQRGYVIYAGRIANPSVQGGAWRRYSGSNPHNHHVHVSVHTQIDSTKAWLLGRNGAPVVASTKPPAPGPTEPRGSFPLPRDHYYGVDDGTLRSHSGRRAADRGAIKLIQRKLKLSPDGRYGDKTRRGVIAWQKAHKLSPDGKVGALTWRAM